LVLPIERLAEESPRLGRHCWVWIGNSPGLYH
jgi:hypothetical protein